MKGGFIMKDDKGFYAVYHKKQHKELLALGKVVVYFFEDAELTHPVLDEKGHPKYGLKAKDRLQLVGFID